ncbi:hypothetical protein QYE76_071731 [Lolium multiflorum]|uniref:F-box domain-containing protein n=1 Tax=Lolium multiflorum TaxID=4521 RepID=A0AAD8WEV4_LOLMU|nr:hypothetical protein QYE76_071731 [Lolium multiflorum]
MESDTPTMWCIHIEAPALKQLALSFSTGGGIRVAVSILAPLLEKVSWRCRYTTVTVGLGRWGLYKVTLKPAESNAQRNLTRSGEDDYFQLPHAHVLCATMLKRVTVRPSDEVTTSNDWCTKIYDIFKAYPFVECNLDLIPEHCHSYLKWAKNNEGTKAGSGHKDKNLFFLTIAVSSPPPTLLCCIQISEGGCYSMDGARRHGGHSELGGPSSGGGADLISALPDDVIIKVLVRLPCAGVAARTSLISRRWRGLWTRLPDLIFLDVVPGLRSSLRRRWPANYVSSLLRAAARLSPAALRFSHPLNLEKPYVDVDLSACFHVATSIELHAAFLCFPGPLFELPALQSLSLSGCRISLVALIPLCPRLSMLKVVDAFLPADDIVIRSASLQELIMENNVMGAWTGRVHVEAPALKQLTMHLRTGSDLSVSVSAPLPEKVSWRCMYSGAFIGLGIWGLLAARLETEKSNGQLGDDAPRVQVLCLHMFARCPRSYPDTETGFATEIEKHMITDFSGLEVHLMTPEHKFGSFMLRLLGMHRIRTATRSLKIILQRFEMKGRCTPLVSCSCDEPKDWTTQTISLTNLEKVEIKGFEGQDHEFDFLKLIFRCAPVL